MYSFSKASGLVSFSSVTGLGNVKFSVGPNLKFGRVAILKRFDGTCLRPRIADDAEGARVHKGWIDFAGR